MTAIEPQVTETEATFPADPAMRAWHRLGLIGVSVLLLNFAFAPFSQFYLAWIGLTPMLLAFVGLKKWSAGFAVGFVCGFLFFLAQLTWIWHTTFLGIFVLLVYLGIFWGFWGVLLTMSRALDSLHKSPLQAIAGLFTIATSYVMIEWARSWIFTGFGWIPFGQSQSPVLAMCQIAEFTGVHGVSFWLVTFNTLLVAWSIQTPWRNRIVLSFLIVLMIAIIAVHGSIMLAKPLNTRGPRVMVVQSAFPHARGGAKLVTFDQQEEYHFRKTREALGTEKPDLIAWSETVLPPMNFEARRRTRDQRLSTGIHNDLLAFVNQHQTSLVFGAYALLHFDGSATTADVRNSVYQYTHDNPDQPRYDKIHLVPFGEIVPFKQSWPWAYNLFMKFAAYSVQYTINPGSREDAKIFRLSTRSGEWKFLTPICFEDIDGPLIASLLRPTEGDAKRADFLVNITNDGWFNERQQWQHLQNAVFRCIENRVPEARSCNMGITAFIDPMGRIVSYIDAGKEGVLTQEVFVRPGVTFYTRYGDLFAWLCAGMSVVGVIIGRRSWVSAK